MAVQAAATGQPATADRNWYSRSTDEVAAALAVDPAVGLTAARAARLLAANGPNALPEEKPKPGWRRFLEQYTTATRGAGRLLRAAGTSGKGQARGRARRCSACCSDPMRPGVRPQMVPPIRLTSSSRVMPDGARNALIWSPSTGSGSTRWASPAASGKPVLRSAEAICSREYCIVTTTALVVLFVTGGSACRESAGIKVDTHRERIRARHRGRGNAQAARQIVPADHPPPLARVVVVQDARRPRAPHQAAAGAHLDPDPRIGLDVLS